MTVNIRREGLSVTLDESERVLVDTPSDGIVITTQDALWLLTDALPTVLAESGDHGRSVSD